MGLEANTVWFEAPGKAVIKKVALEKPGENEILVKTSKSLISTGTELAYYGGSHTKITSGLVSFPMPSNGYNNIGIVLETGRRVKGFKPGIRVLVSKTHADTCIAAADRALAIPEGIEDEQALFATVAAIALHAIRDSNPAYGDNILVLGLGLIGQLAVKLLKLAPVKNIIAADFYPLRRELALKSFADYVFPPEEKTLLQNIGEVTGGKGCESVIEASGNPEAVKLALKAASVRGKIIIVGCPHGVVPLDLYTDLQRKEISVSGSYFPRCPADGNLRYPWTYMGNRQLIIDFLARSRLDFSSLVTHRSRFSEIPELYRILSEEKNKSITAVIDWN